MDRGEQDAGSQSGNKGLKQGLYLQSSAAQVWLTTAVDTSSTATHHNHLRFAFNYELQKRDHVQKPSVQPAGASAAAAGAGGVLQKPVGTAAAGLLRAGVPSAAAYRRSGKCTVISRARLYLSKLGVTCTTSSCQHVHNVSGAMSQTCLRQVVQMILLSSAYCFLVSTDWHQLSSLHSTNTILRTVQLTQPIAPCVLIVLQLMMARVLQLAEPFW
jgi:hypothetical protein